MGGATGNQLENAIGSSKADYISGDTTATGDNAVANRIEGGAGADILEGAAGNDTLMGGAGDDTLAGGAGMDIIDGGADDDTISGSEITVASNGAITHGTDDATADTLTGGAGSDTFIWGNGDTITDFEVGVDEKIDLSTQVAGITGFVDFTDISLDMHKGMLRVTLNADDNDANQTMLFEGLSVPGTADAKADLLDELFDL